MQLRFIGRLSNASLDNGQMAKWKFYRARPLLLVVGACRRTCRIGSRAYAGINYHSIPGSPHISATPTCQISAANFGHTTEYNSCASNIDRNGSNKSRAHHSIRKTPKILDIPLNIQHVFPVFRRPIWKQQTTRPRHVACARGCFLVFASCMRWHMAVLSFAHCHGIVSNGGYMHGYHWHRVKLHQTTRTQFQYTETQRLETGTIEKGWKQNASVGLCIDE